MNYRSITALFILAALVSGCAGKHPQNAEEFRKGVSGATSGMTSMFVKVEKFQVKRPYKAVVKSFRKNAKKCLDVTIKITSRGMNNGIPYVQTSFVTYKPTFRVNGKRAELHVQQAQKGGGLAIKVSEPPPGGYYMMVVDAIPVNSTTTRFVVYRSTVGYAALLKGVKAWAKGRDGCPDLTKNRLL